MALKKTEERLPVYEEKIKVLTKRLDDRQRLLAEAYDLAERRKKLVDDTKSELETLKEKLVKARATVQAKQERAVNQQNAAQKREQREQVRKQQAELFKLMDVINDSGKSLDDVIAILQSAEQEVN